MGGAKRYPSRYMPPVYRWVSLRLHPHPTHLYRGNVIAYLAVIGPPAGVGGGIGAAAWRKRAAERHFSFARSRASLPR